MTNTSQTPFIDIHIHFSTTGSIPSEDEMAKAIRLANYYGIGHMVLLGNLVTVGGPDPKPEDILTINSHTLAALKSHPEAFSGFCYLNPAHDLNFIEDEIERCITCGGMRGIKLWVAVKACDSKVDPIMAAASRLGVPVLHHSWYKQGSYLHNESTPADVAALARRWPDVTVIMAHLGGGRVRGVLDVAELPNVIIDTAGAQSEAGLVEYAVQHIGAHRVIYGSDWPIRDFGAQVGRINGAGITAEEKLQILQYNALRVLGMAGDAE